MTMATSVSDVDDVVVTVVVVTVVVVPVAVVTVDEVLCCLAPVRCCPLCGA